MIFLSILTFTIAKSPPVVFIAHFCLVQFHQLTQLHPESTKKNGAKVTKLRFTNLIDDVFIGTIFFRLRFLIVAGPPLQITMIIRLSIRLLFD